MRFTPTGLTWVQDAASSASDDAGLVVNESRAEQPIMPLRLFASRRRRGAYLVRMLYLGAMIGFFYFTTQYLQGVLGFTPLQAGVAVLPMSAVNSRRPAVHEAVVDARA